MRGRGRRQDQLPRRSARRCIAFAFANGKDPFAPYGDAKAYAAHDGRGRHKLAACKENVKFFWDNKDQLLNAMRTGEIVGRDGVGHGRLEAERREPGDQVHRAEIRRAGLDRHLRAPGKGRNDAAAYEWINFNMRPEIAAKVAASAGNFTASNGADKLMEGKLKAQFAESFPKAAINNIKWYPAVPAGIEEIEGKVLDRVKAGS